MQVLDTTLHDVKLVQPRRFGDSRGWFAEVFNQLTFETAGLPTQFVQDNQSFSTKGVLRGLHYQLGKLIQIARAFGPELSIGHPVSRCKGCGFQTETLLEPVFPSRTMKPWVPMSRF